MTTDPNVIGLYPDIAISEAETFDLTEGEADTLWRALVLAGSRHGGAPSEDLRAECDRLSRKLCPSRARTITVTTWGS